MTIRLHYNPGCPVCARRAGRTARLDWLGRVELRTDDPPLGPVPPGEIVVVDRKSGRAFAGIQATRKLCLQIPLLFPYGLALHLVPLRETAGRGGPR